MCLDYIIEEKILKKDLIVKKLCNITNKKEIFSANRRKIIIKGKNKAAKITLFTPNNLPYISGFHCYSNQVKDSTILKMWNVIKYIDFEVLKFIIPKGTKILIGKEYNSRSSKKKHIVYVTPVLISNN